MPKKLLVLGAMLVLVLSIATPALAQDQDEVPACVLAGACLEPTEERAAEYQYTESPQPAQPFSAPEEEQSFTITGENDNHNQYGMPSSCEPGCVERVVQAAEEAIVGEDPDSGTGTEHRLEPAEAFGAAMDAARSPSRVGEAAASEQPELPGARTPAYRAAFEAAKEAGLDDVAATKAAEVAVAEVSKTSKGGSPSTGIAAAEGKTSKASKDRVSKETATRGKDREDKKSRKDKTREETATNDASEEETTEATDEEAAASSAGEEDGGTGGTGGTGGEGVQTAPAGSRVPLLLGGVAFLAIGGYATLRFAPLRPSIRGRRLLRN